MNGKKARTIRRLFDVKHIHEVPAGDRWMFRFVHRQRRDGSWGPKATETKGTA